jgi:hypothetical protein
MPTSSPAATDSPSRREAPLETTLEPVASFAYGAGLLLELGAAAADDWRVPVGFDRSGWSPTLFRDMAAAGLDVLTYPETCYSEEARVSG